jgi:hypothetical protein
MLVQFFINTLKCVVFFIRVSKEEKETRLKEGTMTTIAIAWRERPYIRGNHHLLNEVVSE